MSVIPAPQRRKTRAESDLEAAFAARAEALPGDFSERAAAFARYSGVGLPHRRIEAYHYTDLRSLLSSAPPPAGVPSAPTATADVLGGVDAARAVFVDGHFVAALSDLSGLGDGVMVTTVATGLATGEGLGGLGARIAAAEIAADPMVALAVAFFTDGVVVTVAAGTRAARPLEIRHLSSGASVSAHVRHAVTVGAGGAIDIIESHESPDGVEIHAHTVTELTIGAGAKATWIDRQREGSEACRFSTLAVDLADEAAFDHSVITLGAKVARTQVFARLGARTDFTTRGATLARGRTHADATLVVAHTGPGGVSRELYKSVVDDEAVSVFQGRIAVESAAQQTDGRMGAHAVLLSDRAEAKAKPELEIFADDVACAHGATVSEIDESLKFYLMSRGIPAEETEKLLIRAFLGEVTDAIASEPIREAIEVEIDAWVEGRKGGAR